MGLTRHPPQLLYGYLIVHIVNTSTIGSSRSRRLLSGAMPRHFNRIGHFQSPHERHGSPSCIRLRWRVEIRCRALSASLPPDLRTLLSVWRINRYSSPQSGMISVRLSLGLITQITLLRWARRIRTIVVVARSTSRRHGRARRSLIAGRCVFPHVNSTLWRTG